MPEDTKPDEQKSSQLEAPKAIPAPREPSPSKDIEDLLKELPKVTPQRPGGPPKPLTLPKAPEPLKPYLPPTKPPSPPPIPGGPKLVPPSASEEKFKTFVRTMEEDLAAAKKGVKPESKPFEIKPPPGGMAPRLTPPPPRTPSPPPKVTLGPAERTKPLEIPKPEKPETPRPGFPKFEPPSLPIPKKGIPFSPRFIIIILVLLVIGAGAWFFLSREKEELVVFTPTPTVTPTPMVTPFRLSELITGINQITIPSTQNFETALKNSLNSIVPGAGQFAVISIADENGNKYSLSQIFQRIEITSPSRITENLEANDWLMVVYGQTETYSQAGNLVFSPPENPMPKLGLIAKSTDQNLLRSALNSWEITMTDDLKNLFNLDSTKASSETFLNNIYRGVDIRYRNFPFADQTIDYAIVFLPEFNNSYFILANSRESIYSAIDLLQER